MEEIRTKAKLVKRERKNKRTRKLKKLKKLRLFQKMLYTSGDLRAGLEGYFFYQFLFFRKQSAAHDVSLELIMIVVLIAEMISFTHKDIMNICGCSEGRAKSICRKLVSLGFAEQLRLSNTEDNKFGVRSMYFPSRKAKGLHNSWISSSLAPVNVTISSK